MTSSPKMRRMKIGMPVFFLSEEDMAIVPGIVMEEVSVRTISGINQFWKIMVGPPNERKIIDTRKLTKVEFYTSLDEVNQILNSRIQEQIRVIQAEVKKSMVAAQNQLFRWYSTDISVDELKMSLESNSSKFEEAPKAKPIESPLQSIFKSSKDEMDQEEDFTIEEPMVEVPVVEQVEKKKRGRKKKAELSDDDIELAQSLRDSQEQASFDGTPRIRKIRLEDGTEIDPDELT